MNKPLLDTALIRGLVSAPVGAGSGPSFDKADAGGNGSLSRQEAKAVEEINFEQVDANGDGQISQSEYKQASGSEGESAEEKDW